MTYRDERVEQAKNKIWAEMMQILYLLALLSFVLKIMLFHQSLSDCVLEYLILIFTPVYQFVRARQLGVVLSSIPHPRTKRLVVSLVSGILVLGLCLTLTDATERPGESIIALVVYAVVFLLVYVGMYRLEKRRKEKLEQKYDEEE